MWVFGSRGTLESPADLAESLGVRKPVTTAILVLAALLLVALALLACWRYLDHRADKAEMARLLATQPHGPEQFTASMVADLPEPARRYFSFTIAERTPLITVARIKMRGKFSLGNRQAPNYMHMQASQVLAAPHGFVWKMSGGSGAMRMSGSDSQSWTRFWLAGLAPVARLGGTLDHARSAFGRYAAEAAFWTPAALLPETGVRWEAINEESARYTMCHGDMQQTVDITVDAEGRPIRVEFQRWSNANPQAVHRLQPFGGFLSQFREIQGFHVPTHVEAGNFFGTEDYFPFFIIDVTELSFPIH